MNEQFWKKKPREREMPKHNLNIGETTHLGNVHKDKQTRFIINKHFNNKNKCQVDL